MSEANETRLITKCRYGIEVINGIFKQQFKHLKQTQNSMLDHIIEDYRIAASLINVFFAERLSDKEDVKDIAEAMKSKLKLKNKLEKYLDLRLTSSQNTFTKIENFQFDRFPKLDIEIIRKKNTFGYYQLHMGTCLSISSPMKIFNF